MAAGAKLAGDKFDLNDWVKAHRSGQAKGNPLPPQVMDAYFALSEACQAAGVPMMVLFADQGMPKMLSEFLDKPEAVPGELLMARACVCKDPAHAMACTQAVMQVSGAMRF